MRGNLKNEKITKKGGDLVELKGRQRHKHVPGHMLQHTRVCSWDMLGMSLWADAQWLGGHVDGGDDGEATRTLRSHIHQEINVAIKLG